MSNLPPQEGRPVSIAGIEIPSAEQSPLVLALVEVIARQQQEIAQLKDLVHKLSKTTRKPRPKPSKLLAPNKPQPKPGEKRPGSAKRKKELQRRVTETIPVPLEDLPAGARVEGHRDFYVQDIEIQAVVRRYRRIVYRLPDGSLRVAPRPAGVDSHFGVGLRQYILLQVHQNHVTQNRLLEELRERGIDISAGQLSAILLQGHDALHAEKDELLPTARQISPHLHVDDTSARHQGKAAVCTHIGNELFASFTTTDRKTRLNFLRLLCQPHEHYRWCEESQAALDWLGAGQKLQTKMGKVADGVWDSRAAWESQLTAWGLTSPAHHRLVSEAALCGTLMTESWSEHVALVSDDAPQFKLCVFLHGLCWVHGERKIDRLIPLVPQHVAAKVRAQSEFWEIYADLKTYSESPSQAAREAIEQRFDKLCGNKTGYQDLNEALGNLHAKKEAFLRVLDRPGLPLHNNLSENDIREYARLRKISGGTRSDAGLRCRDTFMSLKKTCRKLGVSFGAFLQDRLSGSKQIPQLSELMRQSAASRSGGLAVETG